MWVISEGGSLHVSQFGLNVRECDERNLEFWYCGLKTKNKIIVELLLWAT